MTQIIMIASGKGGTGKSTFATYLATELALKGKNTLLIELDAGLRSIDVISGTGRQAVYDIGDVLSGNCGISKAMITSPHTDNLKIVLAPYKNFDADFAGLKSITDEVYHRFDYILIDTAAGVGKAFREACKVAVTAIIVVTPDVISVRDGRLVSDEAYKAGIKDIRLVINKFSRQAFKHSGFEDLDEIIDRTCARLLGVIPMSGQIALSAMSGGELPVSSREKRIFGAVARRITGKDVQILIQ